MSSKLTQVAYHSRKIIKHGAFVMGFLSILTVIVLPIAQNIYKTLNPPQPLPLSSNRSRLPLITFPQIEEYSYRFNFQTANNQLPEFPDRGFVYYISPQRKLGFSTKIEVETTAKNYNFTGQPQSLGEYKYRWVRNAPAPLTLTIDAPNNYSIFIKYQWQNDNTLKSANLVVDKKILTTQAQRVIDDSAITINDVDFDNPQYIFLSDVGNSLDETQSLSEADFVRLDFFKQDITYGYNDLYFYADMDYQERFDKIQYTYKVISDAPMAANVYTIASGDRRRAQDGIIEAKISQSNIDYLNPLAYYLKNVKDAKIELDNGNAYIASPPLLEEDGMVTIRRVYLAYYDSPAYQQYLQPVYIFAENELFDVKNPTLEPGFVAYVPAIRIDQVEGN